MRTRTSPLVAFAYALAAASRAAAHGYLGSVAIDGTTYTGPSPSPSPSAGQGSSAIRQVADIGPVQPATSTDLPCGLSAAAASQEANAKPGSTVEIWWSGGDGQNWPHDTGPVMTYMAECTGVSDCTTFDASKAAWFKIDQLGESSSGTWYQAVFQKKQSLTVTLPLNLPSGHYLFRNEIIALHNAVSEGGAEFYPSCVQLNVQGGSGSTSPNPTVKFPGAYSDSDPGIFVPEIYNGDLQYVYPGGPVSNFASSSDSSGSPPADESGSTSGGDGSGAVASGSVTVPSATASRSSKAAPTTPASSGSGSGNLDPGTPKSAAAICKLAKRSSMPDLRRRSSKANIEKRWPDMQEVRRWKLGHWARMKMRGMMS